ncbi:MAG: YggS family pyridoxal phosphate-dependent enzyme [Pseudomonadota bacterium]
MTDIRKNLHLLRAAIDEACARYGRAPDEVELLAVSKRKPVTDLRAAIDAGQSAFGENYLQEALTKIAALREESVEWHFIGQIQSNKCRAIAENFDWVHTLDRLKVAEKLNREREGAPAPLNCLVQINSSGETSKAGLRPEELVEFAAECESFEHLRIRGLMALPAPTMDFDQQRAAFKSLFKSISKHSTTPQGWDTYSLGTSRDYVAAIAEGATLVRLGEAVFGARD